MIKPPATVPITQCIAATSNASASDVELSPPPVSPPPLPLKTIMLDVAVAEDAFVEAVDITEAEVVVAGEDPIIVEGADAVRPRVPSLAPPA